MSWEQARRHRIRQFTVASLVMAPYSAAFGAMLLSIALWEQTAWGWPALKTGLAIAPGPLLVPVTSLLVAGRLIKRYGPRPVIVAGVLCFASGLIFWASLIGLEPDLALVIIGMIPTGIGVGLTFPTLMGVGASALPSSLFATGSGVINMIRQAALAFGVAIFVAVIGSPGGAAAQLAAFHRGWWVMAAITALAPIPAYFLKSQQRASK